MELTVSDVPPSELPKPSVKSVQFDRKSHHSDLAQILASKKKREEREQKVKERRLNNEIENAKRREEILKKSMTKLVRSSELKELIVKERLRINGSMHLDASQCKNFIDKTHRKLILQKLHPSSPASKANRHIVFKPRKHMSSRNH